MGTSRLVTRRSAASGLGAAALLPAARTRAEDARCAAPADLADGWRVGAADAVGLDPVRLCSMAGFLDGVRGANVHSVLVVRRGRLVFEHYRPGADEHWLRKLPDVAHGPAVAHDMRSVSKSVISLLVGVALDRGLIRGLDEPVFSRFPEYADLRTPEKDRITLRHLLTMSAGLEWNEYLPYSNPANSEIVMYRSPDRWRFALSPRIFAPAGAEWNYSGGCTELLGAVVRKAAGVPLEAFAQEALFTPLDVPDVDWNRYPDGIPAAASGLRLRSRDLAKVGQLVLARGAWNGRRVVPADWIDEATAPRIGPADRIYFYGYHWWLGRSLIGGREIPWIAAMGEGGQRLFIVPSLDLVCAMTAGHYNQPIQGWLPLVLLNRHVLEAVRA